MLKIVLLLALGAVCAVDAVMIFTDGRTANMDFVTKQKTVYELMLHVRQSDLIDAEYYDRGSIYHNGMYYDIESKIDMYQDKNVVKKFIWWINQGLLMSPSAIFSPYNPEQVQEMKMLFELFYTAKDFQTFYKTACWARLHVNSGVFTSAFTVAMLYRSDCKYMTLPPIYEIYPNLFFDSTVIKKAQDIQMNRGNYIFPGQYLKNDKHLSDISGASAMGNTNTYMIYANYSGANMMPYKDSEYKLDYYMEDIGLNAFYFYFRQWFPSWLSSKNYDVPKNIRGELYYFVHQQLMARYNLERMSNGLGGVEDLDWYKPIFPGYYSTLMYSNGVPIPQRNRYSSIPYYKNKYLKDINALEMRIMDAIDSGLMMDEEGKRSIHIYSPEGLNLIANAIEGNIDSCNRRFYGMYEALARDILGFSMDYQDKNKMVPSAIQSDCTSLRDPAFYMLYKRIMTYFFRYKKYQPMYNQSELQLPGVTIESVNIDKLSTYFDKCDVLLNSAVLIENSKAGQSLRLKARRACLNYEPFTYRLNITADNETHAVLRIFLGPAFTDINQDPLYLEKYYKYFVAMDQFTVSLRPGSNAVERQSSESIFTMPDMMPSDMFLEMLNKAINGSEPFMKSMKFFRLSERLTLPRGRPEGMKYRMFFFLSKFRPIRMSWYVPPTLSDIIFDGKPLGFPLDRPMCSRNFTIPNMYFKDVYIYDKGMKF